ncbi:ATP-binding protein [Caulobacter segnis]|uniref:ATP-binding protein n=1 Tax=Caulobacter segnis TaxID=88688 RepID=UPI001CC1067E|nr:winged helix-turn-helix domain-containing protein [Caulobacter segnis]UAL10202.1 winged helix-turn-helix domain-containing protein [Caulobacter segnis]
MSDLAFGPFVISTDGETLYRDGRVVRLGARPRRILRMLAEHAGSTVAKRDILQAVWPDTDVVESNLTVHITALRQALGDASADPRYIVNVPGRGYRLIAEVVASALSLPAPAEVAWARHNLPARLTRVVGRTEDLARIATRLETGRFLTITGPAGVGKTTAALSVAQSNLPRFADGVWFVDLAPLSDGEHVASAIAAGLRLELPPGEPVSALITALSGRRVLVVIDNCEHLIDTVAAVVAAVALACPTVKILATSREPLNVPGETVYRLPPLSTPPTTSDNDLDAVLSYPAVQLLADRAAASSSNFEITLENAGLAAAICRRLDGVPLAIEFAAALVETFGLAQIAERLDEHLKLLRADRRGGAARHRTLDAALEWSFQLLGDDERAVLRRLAIFAGGFTLEAANAVLPDAGHPLDVGEVLASLTLKSLIHADVSEGELRFRVLETTRAFGLLRLETAGERGMLADRHARYFRDFLQQARADIGGVPIAAHGIEIDNVRTALRHALSPAGDLDVALGLASGALPLWLGLSLLTECHARLAEIMPRLSAAQRASVEGWDVAVAMRTAEMFTKGATRSVKAAWSRAPDAAGAVLNSATSTADLLTNWTWNLRLPNYAEMSRLAGAHAAHAQSSGLEHDRIMSAWVMGLSAHHLGELEMARERLTTFLALETVEDRRVFVSHTGFDRTPGARAMLGATLCQMGRVGEGFAEAAAAEAMARQTQKALPMAEGLMWVCGARLIGRADSRTVDPILREILAVSRTHTLDSHYGVAAGLLGVSHSRLGAMAEGEALLSEALAVLTESHYGPFVPWFTGALALSMVQQGRSADALATIERFRDADINGETWCSAEFLRCEALVLRKVGRMVDAEAVLESAIELAQRQGSLAWLSGLAIAKARDPGDETLNALVRTLRKLDGGGLLDLLSLEQRALDLARDVT